MFLQPQPQHPQHWLAAAGQSQGDPQQEELPLLRQEQQQQGQGRQL